MLNDVILVYPTAPSGHSQLEQSALGFDHSCAIRYIKGRWMFSWQDPIFIFGHDTSIKMD